MARAALTHRAAAAGLVLLLAAACGGESRTTLGAPTTPAAGTGRATSTTVPGSPQPAAGTGQATSTTVPGTPQPSPAPKTVRPTAQTTLVTDDDSGTTVHLHIGQRLEVRLTKDTYDPPVSSTGALVRQSSTGGYPTSQPVVAIFDAAGHGTADVTATSDAACFHTDPRCLMPTRTWVVHVTVT